MYRRTNRATPSAPCSYVTQAVAALARAHSEQLDTWLEEAVQTVAAAYLLQVTSSPVEKYFNCWKKYLYPGPRRVGKRVQDGGEFAEAEEGTGARRGGGGGEGDQGGGQVVG